MRSRTFDFGGTGKMPVGLKKNMKCALEMLFALVAFFVIRLYRGRMTKKDGVFGTLPRVAAAAQPYPGLLSAAPTGL